MTLIRSRAEELARIYSIIGRSDSPGRLITMFSAYLDESGTQAASKVLVLAGYVSDIEQWARFAVEWQEMLSFNGLDAFHAHSYRSGQSPYRRMNHSQRIDIGRRVTGILSRRARTGIVSAVDIDSYRHWVVGDIKKIFGTPYSFCMRLCMIHIMRWANSMHVNSPVDYFFEAGAKHSGEAACMYADLQKNPRWSAGYRLGSFSLVPKKESCAVQSADPLAYFARAKLCREMDHIDMQMYDGLINAVPTATRFFDAREMRSSAKVYLQKLRGKLREKALREFPHLQELVDEALTDQEIYAYNAE